MKTFKRGIGSFLRSLAIALGSGVAAYFITAIFTDNPIIVYSISIVICLILVYMTVFSENIKFEVDSEQLRYYKRNKIVYIFDIKDCVFRSYIKTTSDSSGVDHDISFYVTRLDNPEEELYIDCSPIGFDQFEEMFKMISPNEPVKIETEKKESFDD